VKSELGFKAAHRDVSENDGTYALREPAGAYASNFTGEVRLLGLKTPSFGMKALMK